MNVYILYSLFILYIYLYSVYLIDPMSFFNILVEYISQKINWIYMEDLYMWIGDYKNHLYNSLIKIHLYNF